MSLLENKNALPFEAQRHCKLRLEEQKDIHERFENGESIEDIHSSYQFVSSAAIKYWAYNREKDLKRRKESSSYFGGVGTRDKDYYNDLIQRRKDNGLSIPLKGGQGLRSLTGIKLTEAQKQEILDLYKTKSHTERSIAEKLNLPVTIVRSALQSKNCFEEYQGIVKAKKEDKVELYKYIYNLYLEGFTYEEIASETNYSPNNIRNIVSVAKNPKNYLKSRYHIAKIFI